MSEELHEAISLPADWQAEEYPDGIGDCIDLAYQIRAERLDLEKQVKFMKQRELALRNHLYDKFGETGINGARGNIATCSTSEELKPQVTDWEQVYQFIITNNAFELLEKRIARIAYRERYENGIIIPGTEAYLYPKMSLTKVGGKRK
jgi:hypothetical protein